MLDAFGDQLSTLRQRKKYRNRKVVSGIQFLYISQNYSFWSNAMKKSVMTLLLIFSVNTHADWKESAKDTWAKMKEAGKNTVEATKEYGTKISDLTDKNEPEPDKSIDEIKKERFDAIWEDLLAKMSDARDTYDKMTDAPESAWIGADKKSLRKDFNEILADIIVLLDDESIGAYRNKIASLKNDIKEVESEIQTYKEKRISAPKEHVVKTTKAKYDEKIAKSKSEIEVLKAKIISLINRLTTRLKDVGINLTEEQISVLLSRVDSENIIQMSVVFDVLKAVTIQLMELISNTGDNIAPAKRYYGMHVVLLETIIYMQNKYISQINETYLPKLKIIMSETNNLKKYTKKQMDAERTQKRKAIYQSNYQAQNVTIKTANLYINMLNSQKLKVAQARSNAVKDLNLSINTYATIQISSELLQLLKESKNSFDTIMSLQVPEIIPFENIKMQKKFEELSRKIKGSANLILVSFTFPPSIRTQTDDFIYQLA